MLQVSKSKQGSTLSLGDTDEKMDNRKTSHVPEVQLPGESIVMENIQGEDKQTSAKADENISNIAANKGHEDTANIQDPDDSSPLIKDGEFLYDNKGSIQTGAENIRNTDKK